LRAKRRYSALFKIAIRALEGQVMMTSLELANETIKYSLEIIKVQYKVSNIWSGCPSRKYSAWHCRLTYNKKVPAELGITSCQGESFPLGSVEKALL